MCICTWFRQRMDMRCYLRTHVSECSVADSESMMLLMTKALLADLGKRNAMANDVDDADYNDGADNAYGHAISCYVLHG